MSSPLGVDDLKALIIETLDLEGMTPEMIGTDAPLFGDGLGLDSVDALELVVALEKRLGIKIQNDAISSETFASVGHIHRFMEQQCAGARGSS